ncbi:MAG: type 2 isopentenyl-diphosphate Delta-isomerase [Proteobacteria bacterium]|nr:type 2 isopentenyl-diphosphate Delta-isomerase [Pseudomonadota bacterium]
MNPPSPIEARKKAHLDASLNFDLRGKGPGLDNVRLPYDALFEVSNAQLDTHSKIAGIELQFPLMIGAMTGGTSFATAFNDALRALAQKYGIALCLGSMRACLNHPELFETYGTGDVNALFANLGASEISVYAPHTIEEGCKRLGARGLFIHLNGLQEYMQDGGNKDFSISLDSLSRFLEKFHLPVIIKEVGSGIGGKCAQRLASLPIAGIETASLGGTSWIKIEANIGQNPYDPAHIEALNQLGYTLEQSLRDCARALKSHQTLIASGGIANAVDIIKCLALGADLSAIAQPFYAAWHRQGTDGIEHLMNEYIELGRLVWRSTGCRNLGELKQLAVSC